MFFTSCHLYSQVSVGMVMVSMGVVENFCIRTSHALYLPLTSPLPLAKPGSAPNIHVHVYMYTWKSQVITADAENIPVVTYGVQC